MIALRGQSTWRVFIIHVLFEAFADAYKRRGDRKHATLLFPQGRMAIVVRARRFKMAEECAANPTKPALNGVSHFFAAFRYSLQGIVVCFKEESAFRQECLLAIPHFIMLFALQMDLWMRVVLGVLWFLLVVVEMLNTAVEAVVDLASPGKHDLAKKAKDCGSAAVMVLIVAILTCWTVAVVKSFGIGV